MNLKHLFVFLLAISAATIQTALAQRTLVSSDGTVNDLFAKKIGSLMFSNTMLKIGHIKNNVSKTDTIQILNSGSKPLNLSIGTLPGHLSAHLQASVIQPKAIVWLTITYDAAKKNDYGFVMDRFELVTDDSIVPRKALSVTANVDEYFPEMSPEDSLNAPKTRWSEKFYDYGKIQQGDKVAHEFILYNDGKKDLLVHKIKSSCTCLKVTSEKNVVAPGSSVTIKFEFDSSAKGGKDVRRADVFVNDFREPSQVIEIRGEITKKY